jgi:type IV secretory pathway VirB10-like protein
MDNPREEQADITQPATSFDEEGNGPPNGEKPSEQVVVLRPIWRGLIASLFVLIASLCIYNLFHTLKKINHPPSRGKSVLTTASELDTHWYRDEKVKPKPVDSSLSQPISPAQGSLHASLPLDQAEQNPPAIDALQDAMRASITSNQITVELNKDQVALPPDKDEDKTSAPRQSPPENTPSKAEGGALMKKPSPYLLQAGTIIPGILITGINSSLPGQVSAQVGHAVYDSIQGKYLLIPQGSKLIGSYDSKICFGQKRIFLIWQRIILPNGDSISLGEMPGSDSQGYAGFHDQVNNHYTSLFASAALMSILSGGAQIAAGKPQDPATQPISHALAQGAGLHLAETGSQLISKGLEVAPTLEIRPGYLFNITVTKDIIFDQPYGEEI